MAVIDPVFKITPNPTDGIRRSSDPQGDLGFFIIFPGELTVSGQDVPAFGAGPIDLVVSPGMLQAVGQDATINTRYQFTPGQLTIDGRVIPGRTVLYEQTWDSLAGAQAINGTDFIPGGAFVRAMNGATWETEASQNFSFSGDLSLQSNVVFEGSTITPRAGGNFLWGLMYDPRQGNPEKTYDNGDPRWDWNIGGINNQSFLIDYDREIWIGFSWFIPLNYVNDKKAGFYNGDVNQIMHVGDPSSVTSNYFFTMSIGPDYDATPYGDGDAHWMIDLSLNPSGPQHFRIDSGDNSLGSITDDRGKWTDFVIRFRNSPNANGIFQLWKSQGPTRTMTLIAEDQRAGNSTQLSYVNEPIGSLPSTLGMALSPRNYKFNFDNQPTDSNSPIGMALDEWRHGYADQGTAYSDVHPVEEAQP